jgi:Uma2 family endonuclease
MMPPTETTLLTVEEFAKIKDPPGGHYELHHGELVFVTPPKFRHLLLQNHLVSLLKRICIGWFVSMEFPFRPLPEYEVWVADVAMVSDHRFRTISMEDWLEGSLDLVVEVLSPSNTVQEMNDRERICFDGGCTEFWVVDPYLQTIRVSTRDGIARTYKIGDEIPLDRFAPARLAVAEVFVTP